MIKKVAVIGAGISGLSSAQLLKDRFDVTVFEKEELPGGLIKCKRVNGSLFHTCGGHVFNSKRKDVLDWFWAKFNREKEFDKADRSAVVFLDQEPKIIPYPIENHMYLFDEDTQKLFYKDLVEIDKKKGENPKLTNYDSFGDFLQWRFGKTLFDLYFEPYNKKVWRRELTTLPLSWMEGKLPMPTTREMRNNNANHTEEKAFVHSTFWYEKKNGSQYIADKLAEGLHIEYNSNIVNLRYFEGMWYIAGEAFDKVVFCGNIMDLPKLIEGVDIVKYQKQISNLEYHGTTSVFCEIDVNPYSWIYLPSCKYEGHRIICTGNFASTNNAPAMSKDRITATIEFTDYISKDAILVNLKRIPLNPRYLDHKYNQYTYPIQDVNTRTMIGQLKSYLAPKGFYLTGRFADWEYYNMDVAIGAAMDLCLKIK